ncbi:MAG TPA: YncE family protein, partial [Myxococcales bacterium]|nr:YncE family protein [Myxococcales bacterium]
AAGGELGRIRLQPGDGPREVVLSPDRRTLLVANSGSNTVSFVDPASLLETARVQVGEAPTALLVDRAGNRAYVFNARSSFVSVVDLARRAAVGSIATDYAPLRGAINRAGTRLYVVSQGSPYMTAYSLPDQAQAGRVYVGLGTLAVKVDPASDLLYVAQGGSHRLALFDPFSLMPIDFVDLPGDASYLAIDDAENTMFGLMPEQRAAAVVDLATKQLLAVIDVGLDPRMLVLAGERN